MHNYGGQGTSPEWRTIVCQDTLYGKLSSGHCNKGAPKKRYKDSEEVPQSLPYWLQLLVCSRCWPRCLALYCSPDCLLLWGLPQRGPERETPQQLHQSQARPLTAATAAGPACPVLDLLVISTPAVGVDSHLYLIFVSKVKPRRRTRSEFNTRWKEQIYQSPSITIVKTTTVHHLRHHQQSACLWINKQKTSKNFSSMKQTCSLTSLTNVNFLDCESIVFTVTSTILINIAKQQNKTRCISYWKQFSEKQQKKINKLIWEDWAIHEIIFC